MQYPEISVKESAFEPEVEKMVKNDVANITQSLYGTISKIALCGLMRKLLEISLKHGLKVKGNSLAQLIENANVKDKSLFEEIRYYGNVAAHGDKKIEIGQEESDHCYFTLLLLIKRYFSAFYDISTMSDLADKTCLRLVYGIDTELSPMENFLVQFSRGLNAAIENNRLGELVKITDNKNWKACKEDAVMSNDEVIAIHRLFVNITRNKFCSIDAMKDQLEGVRFKQSESNSETFRDWMTDCYFHLAELRMYEDDVFAMAYTAFSFYRVLGLKKIEWYVRFKGFKL